MCRNKTCPWHLYQIIGKVISIPNFTLSEREGQKVLYCFLRDYRHYVYDVLLNKNKKSEICYLFSSYFIQNGNLIIILFIAYTKDLRPIHPINPNYRYGASWEEFKSGIACTCLQLSFTRSVLKKDNILMKYMRFAICYSL